MKKGFLVLLAGLFGTCMMGSVVSAEDETESPWVCIPGVVASVNGEDITAEEFMKLWNQRREKDLELDPAAKPQTTEERKKDVMEQLVIRKLLSLRAEELNIQVYSDQLEQRVQAVESRYGGGEFLDDYLKERNMTREEFLDDLRSSIKVENLLKTEVYDGIMIGPDEARAYYDSTPEEFVIPEQIRGRHILISVDENAMDKEREEAKAAIQKAAKRIRNGEPFEEVARQVSQEPAGARGGDMGYVSRDQMKPEFAKVAFTLEVGEVSEAFESEYGYHLIKVEDKIPATTVSFEAAQPKIIEYLKKKREEEAEAVYVEHLREKAVIFRAEF